jgi:hypothetical protein
MKVKLIGDFGGNPTGVLDTAEKERLAEKEIGEGLREWFEQDRLRRIKTYEAAKRIYLD